MKSKKMTITIKARDIKVRSPFANTPMSGCGAHRSKKDYDRKAQKRATREILKG